MTVRTRFAPSPTGSLHVGGARTALYCLLHARHEGGTFVLRIEDTDQARSTDEATAGIIADLRWLGLDWDEGPGSEAGGDNGPYFQSQRLDLYDQFIDTLLEADLAYEAWETREELDVLRKEAEARKASFRYRRIDYTADDLARFQAEGRTPVVRFAAPRKPITVFDRILGDVTVTSDDLDDLVIRKADGFPTYHFAVVVDDHHMGITQILRGQEHLMNTPKHMVLYEAFGWSMPAWGHMPLIFNPGGSKMSKRDKAKAARAAAREARDARKREGLAIDDWGWLAEAIGFDVDEVTRFAKKKADRIDIAEAIASHLGVELPMIEVMDFRKGGYLPQAVVNYLALLGWSPGDDREIMTLDEMIAEFTLERIGRTPARFDTDKLRWMNGEYIRAASLDALQAALDAWLEVVDSPMSAVPAPKRRQLLAMYQPRINTLAELPVKADFFLARPTEWAPKAVKKHLKKGGGFERLARGREVVDGVEDWSAEGVDAAIAAYCEAHELKLGKIAQPLRVAVSGTGVSPGIGETLAWLDRDEVLARIDACLALPENA